MRLGATLPVLVLLTACEPVPLDGAPCLRGDDVRHAPFAQERQLDLLFVVDSSSLAGHVLEQLPANVARVTRALAMDDLGPRASLRVGVISGDLGDAGRPLPGCGAGEDGVLREGRAECPHPCVVVLEPGDDPATAEARLACALRVETDGCGWEQPLEAALKALSPDTPTAWTAPGYEPPWFGGTTRGHALGANAGLVRDRSMLAIVVITDEDDCSVVDADVLDPEHDVYRDVPLELRCALRPDALHDVERYARGLLALRAHPARLVLFAMVGAPPDALTGDHDALLAHPSMQLRVDAEAPSRVVPSCSVPGAAVAYPPRRIVETARAIEAGGGRAHVASLCAADLRPAFDELLDTLTDSLAWWSPCLPSDIPRPEECVLQEILDPSSLTRCDELPGRRAAGVLAEMGVTRERCEVEHAPAGDDAGWFVERASELPPESIGARRCGEHGAWLRMRNAPLPSERSTLRLACPVAIGPDGGACE